MTYSPLSKDLAWLPADLEDQSRWIYRLTPADIGDIEAALAASKSAGATIETLTRETFPLDILSDALTLTLDRLENDLGLFVLRGLPVERFTKDELRLIYWGIGLHMGTARPQSFKGDVLGDVRDFGQSPTTQTGRGYMSRQGLGFHTDSADIVGLFVLRTAKSGGKSLFCSSVAVADEIARTRPDLFEVLQQPFYHSWKGHEQPGEAPYYQQPIFSIEDGRFSSRWIAPHIWSAQEFDGVPPLTAAQTEAMNLLISLNDDPRFHTSMRFEPGDFQFLNNHVTYHARTEFEDWAEPERKRHLLRLWLAPANSRPLSEGMKEFYKDIRPGAVRGGFPSHVEEPVFVTKVAEF